MSLLAHHAALMAQGESADPHWANVVALLHFDGPDGSTSFPDATGRIWSVLGDVEVDTSQFVFGNASARFNNSRLDTGAHIGFVFGSGAFTIEAWVQFHSSGRGYLYSNSGNAAAIILSQNGRMEAFGPSSWVMDVHAPSAFTIGTWYHVALVRSGNSWTFYRDGVAVATVTDTRTWGVNATTGLGMNTSGTATPLKAFVDELRITKGVARYLSDFTPPSAPFPGA